MKTQLLSTPQILDLLLTLRQTGSISEDTLNSLPVDDRAYFEAEIAVRKATYNSLEKNIPSETDPWVRKLCICYRDLFTNPKKSLSTLEEIIPTCPDIYNLPLRLQFWKAHLFLLTGEVTQGDQELTRLQSIIPFDYLWRTEALVVSALGHFFMNRTHQALLAHYACQNELDQRPDLFFQIFNAAMASRVALKLCDTNAFEYFSQKLESSLAQENDTRFRLRHTSYRGLILNQLGEHQAAEQHWTIGEKMVDETESALERGHYLQNRGLSFALKGDETNALDFYEKSLKNFTLAGSPPHFLAELEIAKKLTILSNPISRGMSLKRTFDHASGLVTEFKLKSKLNTGPIRSMFEDASEFCTEILQGTIPENRNVEFTSVTLSIIDNVSRSETFAKGLSHFRLLPNFIAAVKQKGITEHGVSEALKSVLNLKVLYDGNFSLSPEYSTLENSPEFRTVLQFASTLCELGKNADRLFTAEARLKETQRADFLVHDLEYTSSDLKGFAKTNNELAPISKKLSDALTEYRNSVRNGFEPSAPGIVSLDSLLERVSATIEQRTGKSFAVNGATNIFLWSSEVMLERTLLNLIKNGIDAGHGSCPVTVTISYHEGNTSIRVIDNGAGIPEEVLESVTDSSKSTALSTKTDGLGLGMRSAYDCTAAMGGELRLFSSDSHGTCFEISVPGINDHVSEPCSDYEYIVIDDTETVLESWNLYAQKHNKKIRTTLPRDAVAVLNALPDSLRWIVLDYDMKLPHGNGATLASQLKFLNVKLALSTAFKVKELPTDARAIEWDTIISKEPRNLDDCSAPIMMSTESENSSGNSQIQMLRHEIRNQLTPLRAAYAYVKDEVGLENKKVTRYVSLLGKSIDSMEVILDQTYATEMENTNGIQA